MHRSPTASGSNVYVSVAVYKETRARSNLGQDIQIVMHDVGASKDLCCAHSHRGHSPAIVVQLQRVHIVTPFETVHVRYPFAEFAREACLLRAEFGDGKSNLSQ